MSATVSSLRRELKQAKEALEQRKGEIEELKRKHRLDLDRQRKQFELKYGEASSHLSSPRQTPTSTPTHTLKRSVTFADGTSPAKADLKHTVQQQEHEIARLKAEVQHLRGTGHSIVIEEDGSGAHELRRSHEALVAEKLSLEWRFSKLYRKYDRAHRENVVLVTRVESLERELAALKEGKPSPEADAAVSRAKELEKKVADLQAQLKTAQQQAAAAAPKPSQPDASNQELHMKLAETEDALQNAQVVAAGMAARISALEDAGAAAARATQERDTALAEIAQLKAALNDKLGISMDDVTNLDGLDHEQLKRVAGALKRRMAVLELDNTRQRAAQAQLQRQLFDAQCKVGEAAAKLQATEETSTARVDAIQRRLFEAERAAAHPHDTSAAAQLKLENYDLHAQVRGQTEALNEMTAKVNAATADRDAAKTAAVQAEAQLKALQLENEHLRQMRQQLVADMRGHTDQAAADRALLAAFQREADEAAAMATRLLMDNAELQAKIEGEAADREALAGVFAHAAAQQARADRLQAALGFVDDVATAAAATEVVATPDDADNVGDSTAKQQQEQQQKKKGAGDEGDMAPPAALAERLAAALHDVDAAAGLTPRRRIAHLDWRDGASAEADVNSNSRSSSAEAAASPAQQKLAAAQWRAAAEQANARRLAKDVEKERERRRTGEAILRQELATANAKEDDARTRLSRALYANELLCAAQPATAALANAEQDRDLHAHRVEELQTRVGELTALTAELRQTATEAQLRAASAAQELEQARAALKSRVRRPIPSRQSSTSQGLARTSPTPLTRGGSGSGRATPSSPLVVGVSATNLLASSPPPGGADVQALERALADLEAEHDNEKLQAAGAHGRLVAAEDGLARLGAAEANALIERMRADRLEREVEVLRKHNQQHQQHQQHQVSQQQREGGDDATHGTVAALEGTVSRLEQDMLAKDSHAQELEVRHRVEQQQLAAQLEAASARADRLARRLEAQSSSKENTPSNTNGDSSALATQVDELKLSLSATIRELEDARAQLAQLQQQQQQQQQQQAEQGDSTSRASASPQSSKLAALDLSNMSDGDADMDALRQLIDEACGTSEALAANLATMQHTPRQVSAEADKLAQTLEVAQRVAARLEQQQDSTTPDEVTEVEKAQRASASAETEQLHSDLRQARDEITKLTDDNDILANEVEAKQAQVDDLKRNMHEMAQQIANGGGESVPLADYRQVQDVLRDTEKRLHEQEKANATMGATVEALEARVQAATQAQAEAEEEKENVQAKLMAAEVELARLRASEDPSRVQELEELIRTLSEDVSEGHKKRKELQQEIQDKDQLLQDAHQQARQARLDKEVAEDRATRLQASVSDLTEANERLRSDNRQMRDEVDELKRRVKTLEEELRQLVAAIARLLGIPEQKVTAAYLASLPPMSQDGIAIDRELLQRANDPHARAVLNGSMDELRGAGRQSRRAWTPESGRFMRFRDGSASRPESALSSHYGGGRRSSDRTRPPSSASEHSRHRSRHPRPYPRTAVAIYDHVPDPQASDQEVALRQGDSVLILGPPRRDGLQLVAIRGNRGLAPASHLKELRGKQPRTRLLQQLSGDGVHARTRSGAGSRDDLTSASAQTANTAFPPGAAKMMRARHDFDPSEVAESSAPKDEMLSLKKGDLLTVNVWAPREDGFAKAMAEDGDMGLVPLAFLEDASVEPEPSTNQQLPLPGQTYQERLGGTVRPEEHTPTTVRVGMREPEGPTVRLNGGITAQGSAPSTAASTAAAAAQKGATADDAEEDEAAVQPMSRDALDAAIHTRPSKRRSGLAKLILGSPKHKYKPGAVVAPM
ncbi:hypothetical protein PTSG_04104 [Salpingoeca rosetta]|uniref:SH3 domain-containing protein n=1 Tax=Salpingoeca rosetta (strain ATCC 50818 / BSB-021) TaxID=946362 RepID=F2U6L5_SALR5|nr:uncharacterized protein PTSG_04104 [Salpingoeca rosetta]EGD83497.1 hypothetical protein PTSG_04104 [Salpingoeca rosetta]|eukprot:XP_004995001.1 hypothetical protein PTSG_04104 [Salpingoeca rosetta]